MCIAKNILETRHDAQMCMCIMSCFNDIFAMHIFASCCVTVVSHTLLFNVRAPSWRAQLSHKRSNTMYCSCFFVENDQPTVYRHTHTRLWWIMRWTQFIWLRCTISNLECSKQYGCMIAWFPNMCLLHTIFSNCFSVFQHVFPNCIFQHWMCSDEQVKKTNWMCFN